MFQAKYGFWDVLKEKASGFKGVCLAVTFYETGCIHYGLAPMKVKEDGSVNNWEWFDESRLILVKTAKTEKSNTARSGPDMNLACK